MEIEFPEDMGMEDISQLIYELGRAGTAKTMTMGAVFNRLPADPQRDQTVMMARNELVDNTASINRLFQVVISFVEQGQLLEASKLMSEIHEEFVSLMMAAGLLGMQATGFVDEVTDEVADLLTRVNDNVQAALDRAGLGK